MTPKSAQPGLGELPPLATSVSDNCLPIDFGLRIVPERTILSILPVFRTAGGMPARMAAGARHYLN